MAIYLIIWQFKKNNLTLTNTFSVIMNEEEE